VTTVAIRPERGVGLGTRKAAFVTPSVERLGDAASRRRRRQAASSAGRGGRSAAICACRRPSLLRR
jgi:hypothetical protein